MLSSTKMTWCCIVYTTECRSGPCSIHQLWVGLRTRHGPQRTRLNVTTRVMSLNRQTTEHIRIEHPVYWKTTVVSGAQHWWVGVFLGERRSGWSPQNRGREYIIGIDRETGMEYYLDDALSIGEFGDLSGMYMSVTLVSTILAILLWNWLSYIREPAANQKGVLVSITLVLEKIRLRLWSVDGVVGGWIHEIVEEGWNIAWTITYVDKA